MEISVFTDGSADNMIQDKGGVGVYFPDNKFKKYNLSKQYVMDKCTNQKMEIIACIHAIRRAAKAMENEGKEWSLTIYSDSEYTIKSMTQYAPKWILYGWKRKIGKQLKPISNLVYIKKLYVLTKIYPVKYIHVRSHKKAPPDKTSHEWFCWNGNDEADKLAKSGCDGN